MKKVIVRYIQPSDPEPEIPEQVLLIGPAEELVAKRELAGKEYADSQYSMYYRTFLAARRAGAVGLAVKFDQWLETISEVEPHMSLKEVNDAEGMGEINAVQAEFLRTRIRELGDDSGESEAPRS